MFHLKDLWKQLNKPENAKQAAELLKGRIRAARGTSEKNEKCRMQNEAGSVCLNRHFALTESGVVSENRVFLD